MPTPAHPRRLVAWTASSSEVPPAPALSNRARARKNRPCWLPRTHCSTKAGCKAIANRRARFAHRIAPSANTQERPVCPIRRVTVALGHLPVACTHVRGRLDCRDDRADRAAVHSPATSAKSPRIAQRVRARGGSSRGRESPWGCQSTRAGSIRAHCLGGIDSP